MPAMPPVPSPCSGVCRISAVTGWCEGCLRRLEEVGRWSSMDDEERRAVLAHIDARRASLAPRPDT